ncbi:MAG: hypothetical protein P8I74_05470 [Phycisphaerales bacterium]|nr:hypothetical protein [Phycisphaerales bacterium]
MSRPEDTMDVEDLEPCRSIRIALIHLAVGCLILVALFLTVHNRNLESDSFEETWVASGVFQDRWTDLADHWIEDGYLANAGLWYLNSDRSFRIWVTEPEISNSGWISKETYDPEAQYYYRSNPILSLAPLAAAQRLKTAVAGGSASRSVTILYGQTLTMLTGCLIGIVATVCCRRIGLPFLHALALGICAQIVFQTHPLNLAAYFRLFFQHALMLPTMLVIVSLLMPGHPRTAGWIRATGMLLLSLAEPVTGFAFIVGYLVLGVLIDRTIPWFRRDQDGILRSHRFGLTIVLPWLGAMAIILLQLTLAKSLIPNAELVGATSSFRTGLDGNTRWYTNLHGAFRKMVFANYLYGPGRSNIGGSPIFWGAGFASIAIVILSAAWTRKRGRSNEAIHLTAFITALLSTMFGILAVTFNNAMAIHPFIYPLMILPGMCLAMFAFLPAIIARTAKSTWPVVALIVFIAFTATMANIRYFSVTFPISSAAGN